MLLWFPQEYINKQWHGCRKRTNINSITTTTISINVNLQQSIKIRKSSVCLKDKKRPLTWTIFRDLICWQFEVCFFLTKVRWSSFLFPWTLNWLSKFAHATTIRGILNKVTKRLSVWLLPPDDDIPLTIFH